MLAVEIITAVFASVTVPVYLLLLRVLLFNKSAQKLDRVFRVVAISQGVGDLLSLMTTYVGVQLPRWGCFINVYREYNAIISPIVNHLSWSLPLVQTISLILLAASRFSLIVLYEKYDEIWSKRILTTAIVMKWAIAFLYGLPVVYVGSYYSGYPFENSTSLKIFYRNDAIGLFYFGTMGILTAIAAPTIFTLYGLAFFKMKKTSEIRRRPLQSASNAMSTFEWKVQQRLVFYGMFMTLLFAICSSYLLSVGGHVFILTEENYEIGLDVIDNICCGVTPYLMIAMSSVIRKLFIGSLVKNWQMSSTVGTL